MPGGGPTHGPREDGGAGIRVMVTLLPGSCPSFLVRLQSSLWLTLVFLCNEIQGNGIDTISAACGFGAVFKYMAQMRSAASAKNLRAVHAVVPVIYDKYWVKEKMSSPDEFQQGCRNR